MVDQFIQPQSQGSHGLESPDRSTDARSFCNKVVESMGAH